MPLSFALFTRAVAASKGDRCGCALAGAATARMTAASPNRTTAVLISIAGFLRAMSMVAPRSCNRAVGAGGDISQASHGRALLVPAKMPFRNGEVFVPKRRKRRRLRPNDGFLPARLAGRWPRFDRAISDPDRGLDALAGEWQFPQVRAGRVGNRIGERRSGRSLRGLAGAQEWLLRPVDKMDLDTVRQVGKAHDRVGAPIPAGNLRSVERHLFVQGPACGLHDAALDLIANAIGIDDLTAVVGGDEPDRPHAAAFALDLDLDCNCRIGGEILVACKAEAAAAVLRRPLAWPPAEALGGQLDDVARADVLQVPQPELDRVRVSRLRQLVHDALGREHVHVGAEPAQ